MIQLRMPKTVTANGCFDTLELQYVNTLVPELSGAQNWSRSFLANDLLRNQVNLTPSQVLMGPAFRWGWSPDDGQGWECRTSALLHLDS